ncbi:hypothetical protein WA158_000703 [Blastocystis sp. Blastoise]
MAYVPNIKKKSNKNQLRDLKRLLTKKGIDPENEKQIKQKIEDLESRVFVATHTKEYKKNKEDHKKLKFFDKTKIERRMNKINVQLKAETSEEEKQKLTTELDLLNRQLDYIHFYPDTIYYISLYPSSELSEKLTQQREQLMIITQKIKEKSKKIDEDFLKRDVVFRKKAFHKGLEALSKLKKDIESKLEKDVESDDLHDDFFISGENQEE